MISKSLASPLILVIDELLIDLMIFCHVATKPMGLDTMVLGNHPYIRDFPQREISLFLIPLLLFLSLLPL